MNIEKLNEKLDSLLEEVQFSDFDVEGLYKTIIPKEFHVISNEEIQQVKDFIPLTGNETEPELIAIRNAIVKYCADKAETIDRGEENYKVWKEENPEKSFSDFMKQNAYDILWDQMSAFTHVIDMELYKLNESCKIKTNESINEYKVIAKILEGVNGYNITENDRPMLLKDVPNLKDLLTQLAKHM